MSRIWLAATLACGTVLLTSVQASAQTAAPQATLAAPSPGETFTANTTGACPIPCEEGDMRVTVNPHL